MVGERKISETREKGCVSAAREREGEVWEWGERKRELGEREREV